MNSLNHFIASFLVLFYFFRSSDSLIEIILFALVFGVLIDLNQFIGRFLKKPTKHERTWIEEPFGFILLGFPIAIILSFFKKEYFFLTIIPFGIHILLDYLTIHEVSPFAPFSDKNIQVGFFKSYPKPSWCAKNKKGISENYFLLLNIILLILLVTF